MDKLDEADKRIIAVYILLLVLIFVMSKINLL